MDALLAEYGEDRYPKVRQDSANLQACLIATQCILAGLSVAEAPLELPYTVCGLIVDSDWGFDKLHEGMMQMLPPPGHHAGDNGDAQPCC